MLSTRCVAALVCAVRTAFYVCIGARRLPHALYHLRFLLLSVMYMNPLKVRLEIFSFPVRVPTYCDGFDVLAMPQISFTQRLVGRCALRFDYIGVFSVFQRSPDGCAWVWHNQSDDGDGDYPDKSTMRQEQLAAVSQSFSRDKGHRLLLPKPVPLQPDNLYMISAVIKAPPSPQPLPEGSLRSR